MPDHMPRLELQQSQRLLMTPMMQQAVQILQMSALQLEQYLQQEMRENPVLEEGLEEEIQTPEEEKAAAEAEAAASGAETPEPPAAETKTPESEEAAPSEEKDEPPDVDWSEYFGDAEGASRRTSTGDEEGAPTTEAVAVLRPSLHDHLHWQLRMATEEAAVLTAGARIIGQVDEDGYLRTSLDDLALGADLPRTAYDRALRLIQAFEPIGVGAHDLRECLLLQIRHHGEEGSWAEAIVREYLPDLEKNRLPQIAKALGIRIDAAKEAAAIIGALNPRPGRAYSTEEPRYVVPDVFIETLDGQYVVSLNDDWFPRVRLSPYYHRLYEKEKRTKGSEVAEYLKGRIQAAVWLLKSIHQRQATIYRVTESISRHQRGFLDHGIKHLRPLTLRQIAEDIQMHESTVSRVTTNKYVQSPRGTFELKYFFSSGIGTESGDEASSKSIKAIMKEIIAGEDTASPLSDQKIAEVLNSRGFHLARRTVTKYREALGLLPASRRRAF